MSINFTQEQAQAIMKVMNSLPQKEYVYSYYPYSCYNERTRRKVRGCHRMKRVENNEDILAEIVLKMKKRRKKKMKKVGHKKNGLK